MAKVIIDSRENKELVKELIKEGIEVEIKQLEVADFIVQTKDLEDNIQTVGIERKTTGDFLNSIIDKRLINQIILLKENFDIPLVIIEGEENMYALRDFHPNAIRGMLCTITIDFQIPILYTKNIRDTIKYISLIAKRLEKPRKQLNLTAKKRPLTIKEQQLYFVECLPGIGQKIAKSLLVKFKSIKNLINASEKELQEVDKIGKIKASELKKIIEEEFIE